MEIQSKHFTNSLRRQDSNTFERPNFPLPIKRNKITMNQFSIEELRKAYAFHRNGSNHCLDLFNFYVNSDLPTDLKEFLTNTMQGLTQWHTRQMFVIEQAIEKATGEAHTVK